MKLMLFEEFSRLNEKEDVKWNSDMEELGNAFELDFGPAPNHFIGELTDEQKTFHTKAPELWKFIANNKPRRGNKLDCNKLEQIATAMNTLPNIKEAVLNIIKTIRVMGYVGWGKNVYGIPGMGRNGSATSELISRLSQRASYYVPDEERYRH
jgi:hypothetical protein